MKYAPNKIPNSQLGHNPFLPLTRYDRFTYVSVGPPHFLHLDTREVPALQQVGRRNRAAPTGTGRGRSELAGVVRNRAVQTGKASTGRGGRNRTEQDGTSRTGADQGGTGRYRSERIGKWRNMAEQDGTGRISTEQGGAGRNRAEQDGTARRMETQGGPGMSGSRSRSPLPPSNYIQ